MSSAIESPTRASSSPERLSSSMTNNTTTTTTTTEPPNTDSVEDRNEQQQHIIHHRQPYHHHHHQQQQQHEEEEENFIEFFQPLAPPATSSSSSSHRSSFHNNNNNNPFRPGHIRRNSADDTPKSTTSSTTPTTTSPTTSSRHRIVQRQKSAPPDLTEFFSPTSSSSSPTEEIRRRRRRDEFQRRGRCHSTDGLLLLEQQQQQQQQQQREQQQRERRIIPGLGRTSWHDDGEEDDDDRGTYFFMSEPSLSEGEDDGGGGGSLEERERSLAKGVKSPLSPENHHEEEEKQEKQQQQERPPLSPGRQEDEAFLSSPGNTSLSSRDMSPPKGSKYEIDYDDEGLKEGKRQRALRRKLKERFGGLKADELETPDLRYPDLDAPDLSKDDDDDDDDDEEDKKSEGDNVEPKQTNDVTNDDGDQKESAQTSSNSTEPETETTARPNDDSPPHQEQFSTPTGKCQTPKKSSNITQTITTPPANISSPEYGHFMTPSGNSSSSSSTTTTSSQQQHRPTDMVAEGRTESSETERAGTNRRKRLQKTLSSESNRLLSSDNSRTAATSPASTASATRRANQFLTDLKMQSVGAVKMADHGDDGLFVMTETEDEVDDANNQHTDRAIDAILDDSETASTGAARQRQHSSSSRSTLKTNGDDTLNMTLSASADEGDHSTGRSSKPNGIINGPIIPKPESTTAEGGGEHSAADDEKTLERPRRKRTYGSAGKSAPGHRRTRSGDQAAATLMTGGTDWIGMEMDQLPLPDPVHHFGLDDDDDDDDDQADDDLVENERYDEVHQLLNVSGGRVPFAASFFGRKGIKGVVKGLSAGFRSKGVAKGAAKGAAGVLDSTSRNTTRSAAARRRQNQRQQFQQHQGGHDKLNEVHLELEEEVNRLKLSADGDADADADADSHMASDPFILSDSTLDEDLHIPGAAAWKKNASHLQTIPDQLPSDNLQEEVPTMIAHNKNYIADSMSTLETFNKLDSTRSLPLSDSDGESIKKVTSTPVSPTSVHSNPEFKVRTYSSESTHSQGSKSSAFSWISRGLSVLSDKARHRRPGSDKLNRHRRLQRNNILTTSDDSDDHTTTNSSSGSLHLQHEQKLRKKSNLASKKRNLSPHSPHDSKDEDSSFSRTNDDDDEDNLRKQKFREEELRRIQAFDTHVKSLTATPGISNRGSFAPTLSSVPDDEDCKYPTFRCPRCNTRQREFFSVNSAPRQFESPAGYLAIYFVIYVIASLFVFGLEEGWPALDCVYFAVITVTTAGLGDYVPSTDSAKITCSIFIYFGVACIGLLLGSLLASGLDDASRKEQRENQVKNCSYCSRLEVVHKTFPKGTHFPTERDTSHSSGLFSSSVTNTDAEHRSDQSVDSFPSRVKRHKPDTQDELSRSSFTNERSPSQRSLASIEPSWNPAWSGYPATTPKAHNMTSPPPVTQKNITSPPVSNNNLSSLHAPTHISPSAAAAATAVSPKSPAPDEILRRQAHSRHYSFDVQNINNSNMRMRYFSQDMAQNNVEPIIDEGISYGATNDIPPVNQSYHQQDSLDGFDTDSDTSSSTASSDDEDLLKPVNGVKAAKYVFLTLKQAVANSLFIIAIGSIGFYFIERMTVVDSFYFTTVLLTTVGYGDIVPQTSEGKVFATVYVLVAGTVLLHNMSLISMIPLELRKRRIEQAVLMQFGNELDDAALRELATGPLIKRLQLSTNRPDGLDECTREMFALAMLVRLGRISEQDVKSTFNAFRRLDVDNDGKLNSKDIVLGEVEKRRRTMLQRRRHQALQQGIKFARRKFGFGRGGGGGGGTTAFGGLGGQGGYFPGRFHPGIDRVSGATRVQMQQLGVKFSSFFGGFRSEPVVDNAPTNHNNNNNNNNNNNHEEQHNLQSCGSGSGNESVVFIDQDNAPHQSQEHIALLQQQHQQQHRGSISSRQARPPDHSGYMSIQSETEPPSSSSTNNNNNNNNNAAMRHRMYSQDSASNFSGLTNDPEMGNNFVSYQRTSGTLSQRRGIMTACGSEREIV